MHTHTRHDLVLSRPRNIDLTRRDDCVDPDPSNSVTDRINTLLNSSGPGYTLKLCVGKEYILQSPLLFAAPNQEISTQGYPTDASRATLVVNGVVRNGTGHTTAVDGTCDNCSGIMLRNIQINGARRIAPPTSGGANIEFGGGNANQTIQFVRSYDPRSWSCLHIAEGPFTCSGVLVQNNDIGPCGVDAFQEWADGISVSCRNAVVRNNMVQGATDGGIVLFGSPGTQVYNNTIWVTNQTMLGGINMVDFLPWQGDYTDTVVRDNTILGGFATSAGSYHSNKGTNADDVVMKIAIAIGPRTWFGDRYQENVSFSGTVLNNRLSGAFSYGIAMSTARNFTIKNNVLFGNSSFIGASGPNCSASDVVPNPAPFVYDKSATEVTLQPDFQLITDAESLTCVRPPEGGNYWPYGGNPGSAGPTGASPAFDSSSLIKTASSSTAAVVLGVIAGITALGVATWFIRKWLMRRLEEKNLYNAAKELAVGTGPGYVKHE